MRAGLVRKVLLVLFFVVPVASTAMGQSGLEEGKRAYFEGRFEDSIRSLEPELQSLTEPSQLREVAFFLGLSHSALGNKDQSEQYFQSSVRHDPSFQPGSDIFSPDIVSAYGSVRSAMVGRLRVESEPAGADVFVSGTEIGQTPFEGAALQGEQLVRVAMDGYANEERTVNVRPGEDTSVSVELQSRRTASSPAAGSASQTADTGGGGNGKTIGILAGVGGGVAVLAAVAGGGDDSGTSSTNTGGTGGTNQTVTRGVFAANVTPSPVVAETSTGSGFQFVARFTVNITESAGLGGNVDFINVTLTSNTGASTSAVNFGASDVISRAGSNRVEARSRLQVPVGVVYTFSTRRSNGSISIEIQVTDDRGNSSRVTATANLQ